MTRRAIVVGAGISGLSAAVTLDAHARQAGLAVDLTVLEAADAAGGHARTSKVDGFLVEAGPNGFLDRSSEARALVELLGLTSRLVKARPEAKRRFILRGGRLRLVPDSPMRLLTSDALSWPGRLRVLGEPLVRPRRDEADETVYDFARRRIGAEAAATLVDTAVAGISAGDSRQLSLAAQFPLMRAMEREHGSLVRAMMARRRADVGPPTLVAFDEGMSTLVGAMAARLGPSLRLASPIRAVTRAADEWRVQLEDGTAVAGDCVLLAAPARAAARMVDDAHPQLAAELGGITYAGVAVVSLGFRLGDIPRGLDGYGYLVARSEGLATLGVVWESSLFAGRAREGTALVRVMLGGSRRPEVVGWPEEQLARVAREELAPVMGVAAEPVLQSVARWPRAIAQYTVGHLDRRARIAACLAGMPGLAVCGSSYDGVSFTDAIGSGVRAGRSMADALAKASGRELAAAPAAAAGER